MEPNKIPPKSEWKNFTVSQLFDLKSKMTDTYYGMRQINASFAPQYLKFISEIDVLIQTREAEAEAERQEAQG
jgi:hypothetical protein